MERLQNAQTNGTHRERFAQVLTKLEVVPEPIFGRVILEENLYAVSFEDTKCKIPSWAHLKLAPHRSTDMHGSPRTSYMVALQEADEEPRKQLDRLIRQYGNDDLIVAAVHAVKNVPSTPKNENINGQIVRTIKPSQNLYYRANDLLIALPQHQDIFLQAVRAQLSNTGSHESLDDFNHTVSVVKTGNRSEYQYSLPADIPEAFIKQIQTVGIESERHGNRIQVTFKVSKHEPHVLPFRPRVSDDPKGDTGVASVYEHFILHPEQNYLNRYLSARDAELVHFDIPSTTCAEKCDLLNSGARIGTDKNWSLDNIVAAYYFSGPEGYIVLAGPRMSEVKAPEVLLEQITDRYDIKKSKVLPDSMEYGTCTPFVNSNLDKEGIDRIVLLGLPDRLMDQPADYSIGGRGPSAHRASIQMTPRIAENILRKEFGPKVTSIAHPYAQYW